MDNNTALIERFYNAFQKLDYKTMQDCYSDDIIFSDPVFGLLQGDEAKAMWEMLCKNAKDLSLTYSNIQSVDQEYYTCNWTATYTFSKTGKKVVNNIKAFMKIKDGKIIEHSDGVTEIVHLECSIPTGDVNVNGPINTCPILDDFTASPLALHVGGVSALKVSAHDPNLGPQALSYAWSVNDVRLPNQSAASLNFACSSPGDLILAVSVSDGDPACATATSVKVSCE